MGNISFKVNLKGLKNAFIKKMKKKNGEMIDVLIIPIADNHLYVNDKAAYLDLQGFVNPNPKEGGKESHLIKQSLPTDVYKALTEEQRKAMPLLGNATVWGESTGSNSSNSQSSSGQSSPAYTSNSMPDEDDLPF